MGSSAFFSLLKAYYNNLSRKHHTVAIPATEDISIQELCEDEMDCEKCFGIFTSAGKCHHYAHSAN